VTVQIGSWSSTINTALAQICCRLPTAMPSALTIFALRDEGFYAWFNTLPFCPCRFNGQGTRPKGLGFRRIASGSCPYEPILDSSGRFAYSVNADSRRLRAERGVTVARTAWRTAFLATIFVLLLTKAIRSWPCLHAARKRFRKEVKPRVRDAMRNTVIFRAVRDRIGQPVYYFSDDFRVFFYQVKLAVHCLWFSGILLYVVHVHVRPRQRHGRV
jgi:hypothetical protein